MTYFLVLLLIYMCTIGNSFFVITMNWEIKLPKANKNDNNLLDSTVGVGVEETKLKADASFGLTTQELKVGIKTSDINTSSFKIDSNLFNIYSGFSATEQIDDNINVTQFAQFNMNKLIPITIYLLGPVSAGFGFNIPAFGFMTP